MAHNQPNVKLYSYDNAELLLDAQTLRISVKNNKLFLDEVGKIQLDKLHSQVEVSFITGLFAIGRDSAIFSSNEAGRTFRLNGNLNIAEEHATNRKHLILNHISISSSIKIKSKIYNLNSSLNQ